MKLTLPTLALGAGTIFALGTSASAQNTAFNNGSDVILTFQDTATSITLTATAGTTGTTAAAASFRDAASGSFTNLTNIGSALSAAFGSGWANSTTLYGAVFTNRGTDGANAINLSNLDPQATLYFSRARDTIGTVGQQNSTNQAVSNGPNNQNFSAVANGIAGVKSEFEGAGTGSFPTFQSTFQVSSIDDQMPFITPGVQASAFGALGAIQDNFGAGNLGTFGTVTNVELAFDFFRAQPRNNVPGQYNFGSPDQSEYLGTFTINNLGDIGFTANTVIPVPEPSTALLGLFTAFGAATLRRRKVTA